MGNKGSNPQHGESVGNTISNKPTKNSVHVLPPKLEDEKNECFEEKERKYRDDKNIIFADIIRFQLNNRKK